MKFQLITSCKDLCAMNYIKETFWSLLHINIDELYMRYCSFSPVEEGRWSSSYCKLWDSSYFGILKGWNSWGLTWWSGWKVGEITFSGQNCTKSLFCELVVAESWFTPQNDRKTWFTVGALRHVYPSDNRKCPKDTVVFGGPCNDVIITVQKFQWSDWSNGVQLNC